MLDDILIRWVKHIMLDIKKYELVEEVDNTEFIKHEKNKNIDDKEDDLYPSFDKSSTWSKYSSSFHVSTVLHDTDGKRYEVIKNIPFCNFSMANRLIEDSIIERRGIFEKFDKDMITDYYGEHDIRDTPLKNGIVPFNIANWYNINLKGKWNIVPHLDINHKGIEYMVDSKNKDVIDVDETLKNIFVPSFKIYFETKSEWTRYKLISS